jgi:hypothetical protein
MNYYKKCDPNFLDKYLATPATLKLAGWEKTTEEDYNEYASEWPDQCQWDDDGSFIGSI